MTNFTPLWRSICVLLAILCLASAAYATKQENGYGKIEQAKDMLMPGEEAVLTIQNSNMIDKTQLCFDFPVPASQIRINTLQKKNFLWFNTEQEYYKDGSHSYCLNILDYQDTFVYSMEYIGYGIIKYNVTLRESKGGKAIVLDPYLIGSLGSSSALLLKYPFDGSIENMAPAGNDTFSLFNSTEYTDGTAGWQFKANYTPINHRLDMVTAFIQKLGGDGTGTNTINFTFYYSDGTQGSVAASPPTGYAIQTFTNPYPGKVVNDVVLYHIRTNPVGYNTYTKNATMFYNNTWNATKTSWQMNGTYSYDFLAMENISNLLTPSNKSSTTAVIINNAGAYCNGTSRIDTGDLANDTNFSIFMRYNMSVYQLADQSPLLFERLNSLALMIRGDGTGMNRSRVYFWDTGGNFNEIYSTNPISPITGQHDISVTYDNSSKLISMYVDGVLNGSATIGLSGLKGAGNSDYRLCERVYAEKGINASIQKYIKSTDAWTAAEAWALHINGSFAPNSMTEPNTSLQITKNEKVFLGNVTVFNSQTGWTLSLWLNMSAQCFPQQNILEFGKSDSLLYLSCLGNLMVLSGKTTTAGNDISLTDTKLAFNPNLWQHYVFTWDGTTAKAYWNGSNVLNDTSIGALMSSSADIAWINSGGNLIFSIDELYAYQYPLTLPEIKALYQGYGYGQVDSCNYFNNTFLNFEVFNQDAYSQKLNNTMEINLRYWFASDPTTVFNYSAKLSGSSNYSLCLGNYNSTLGYDIYAKQTTDPGFTHRLYLYNQSWNGTSSSINMGNYNSTGASLLKITLRDKFSYAYVSDIVGLLQQYYVSDMVWRPIQWELSDDYGLLVYHITEESQDYRLLFSNTSNYLLAVSDKNKFSCTVGVCELTFFIDRSTGNKLDNFAQVTVYDNSTHYVYSNWTDDTGLVTSVRWEVKKWNGNATIQLCNQVQTGASGQLNCSLGTTTGLIQWAYYTTESPAKNRDSGFIQITGAGIGSFLSRDDSTLFSFLIYVGIVGAGIITPALGPIAAIFGLIILQYLKIALWFSIGMIIGSSIIGILIGLKVRQ